MSTANERAAKRYDRWVKKNTPYAAALEALLVDLGAVPTGEELCYKYTLATKVGLLKLDVITNVIEPGAWIAGRFENVDEAVKLLNNSMFDPVNRYSGKWNHHFFSVSLEDAERTVRREFAKVLP